MLLTLTWQVEHTVVFSGYICQYTLLSSQVLSQNRDMLSGKERFGRYDHGV